MKTKSLTLRNRHSYNLQFSPFNENLLAIVTSSFYGSKGKGTIYLLEVDEDDSMNHICKFKWPDGLFDLVWCKQNHELLASSSGDGNIQIWNVAHPENQEPLCRLQEHKEEVYSIDWNSLSNGHILSGSWDRCVKLWDPLQTKSISTFQDDNSNYINCIRFANFLPNLFSSVSINGLLKFWNSLDFSGKSILSVHAHDAEVLCCDWSEFYPYLLATGASDGLIRFWDLRFIKNHIFECQGHEYAVKRIKFSPFSSNVLISSGYDTTTRFCEFTKNPCVNNVINYHEDVVHGVCWNTKKEGQIADCGWDETVNVLSDWLP